MKDLVILGSSGLAKEIYFLIKRINAVNNEWNVLGFVDIPECLGKRVADKKVTFTDDMLFECQNEIFVAIGLGFPKLIKKVVNKFQTNQNILFPNLIDPSVIADWDTIQLGIGNVFTAGNILTTDIKINSYNIFNLNCTIGHDVSIGSYNVFNPASNISGSVSIHNEILIGTGAQIMQDLSISSDVTIGLGSVVVRSVTEPGTYFGAPAKRIN